MRASDLLSKIFMHRGKKLNIAFISTPTPILMKDDRVISPNRTNYFPFSQLLLATCVKARLEHENIPHFITFNDYKSLKKIDEWKKILNEYGTVKYGNSLLKKCVIGNGLDRMKDELGEFNIICVTANFTFEANIVVKSLKIISKINKNALILVGGRDASARPKFYLANNADIVAIGDSDLILPEFICRLYKGINLGEMSTDSILHNTLHKINLNNIPILNFNFIKNRLCRYNESGAGNFIPSILKKGNFAYYETSRGCCRECGFCTERLSKRVEIILPRHIEWINAYISNGISTVMFSDDNIMLRLNKGATGEDELQEMFDYLRQNNMVWEFSVGLEIGKFIDSRTNKIKDSLIRSMFWNNNSVENFSGSFRVLIPVENSFSGENEGKGKLSKMRKYEDNLKILDSIISQGIPQINIGIMIGWPNESLKNIKNIQERVEEVGRLCNSVGKVVNRFKTKLNYSFFCVTPLPGTPFYHQMIIEKRIVYDIETDPELWSLYTSVLNGDYYTPNNITDIRQNLLYLFDSHHIDGKVRLHI